MVENMEEELGLENVEGEGGSKVVKIVGDSKKRIHDMLRRDMNLGALEATLR